jgi:ABC-type oligopeptide transport system ATPase subunit
MEKTMLEVKDLTKRYSLHSGFFAPIGEFVYAVNGVSFQLKRGEIYGLVGESGSGKTTIARMLVRLVEPTSGKILYFDQNNSVLDVTQAKNRELKTWRGLARYIFQDPARSLNPRQTINDILIQAAMYNGQAIKREQLQERAKDLILRVGLRIDDLNRRPADFSGGQRQRISIARALMSEPELLICDEVVSALDVSIQAQILRLLLELRSSLGLTMIFIAHDLAVVHYLCDRVGVIYEGKMVEEGDPRLILNSPQHPYTQRLLASIPVID